LLIEGLNIEKVFIHLNMKSIRRLEKSTHIPEAEGFPVLLPTSDTSADIEVEGPEKEEELGIFQVLDRLEEVANMLISR